jgi:hypothetical protein
MKAKFVWQMDLEIGKLTQVLAFCQFTQITQTCPKVLQVIDLLRQLLGHHAACAGHDPLNFSPDVIRHFNSLKTPKTDLFIT